MKIVYLTLEAPREGQASYVHVHEIIDGLEKQGVKVRLYQPPYAAKPVSPNHFMRLLYALWLQCRLWACWERGSVLYVRAHYLAFPSALIARLFRIPVFQEINGPYEDVFVTHPSLKIFRNILIPMQRWQYRVATGLITVTQALQGWANAQGRRTDCTLISNGANTNLFKPGLSRPEDAPKRYVVFFGGLTRWHGVPVMLGAVQSAGWPENVKLVVIGDGQETPSIQEACKDTDRIVFLGKRPYKDVAPYVSNALAGLVIINNPDQRSSTGVLPLKLYETLACGVPAIVTDLPGQADLVRREACGLVIPVDDPSALASAVTRLSVYPQEAEMMGRNGHEAAVRDHSWFARAQQTLAFIKSNLP
ncbi:MAG: glycosyltransferase family 4 protein [Alphaproteobacteria bacterium]|nr:glycosyltransferase family 4 protein [Alphaproteobacteria bacterium]